MTLFENKQDTNDNNNVNNSGEESVFDRLVGDGKKFASSEDLAKGKLESDNFIEQLKQENEQLRQDLEKRLSAEEVLNKIKEDASKTSNDNTNQMSADDISNLVRTTVGNLTAEERMLANINKVDSELTKLYGEKVREIVTKRAGDLGMNLEQLKNLAATSPQAVIYLFHKENTNIARPADGSINSNALGVNTSQNTENYAYFEKLRKENPREYFTPKVQNRMMKLAEERGPAFYD